MVLHQKAVLDSLDLRDFEGELPVLYILFRENKTNAKRTITLVWSNYPKQHSVDVPTRLNPERLIRIT